MAGYEKLKTPFPEPTMFGEFFGEYNTSRAAISLVSTLPRGEIRLETSLAMTCMELWSKLEDNHDIFTYYTSINICMIYIYTSHRIHVCDINIYLHLVDVSGKCR